MEKMLLLAIGIPIIFGVWALVLPKYGREAATILATVLNLVLCVRMYNQEAMISLPWGGYGILFELRLYHFSSFILAAAAGFGFLVSLYSLYFMKNREKGNQYYAYLLLSLGMVNGAVLANNLVLMLFFWEGLLGSIFGFIAIGHREAFRSAVKAFVLIGVSDVLMMAGIAMTGMLAGTLTMSEIHLPLISGLSCTAFLLLAIGATSKAGSLPFHSWIPDAATDAPLPFMALMPAALEKLLGIYFLARITLDLYALQHGSLMSAILMTFGVITILVAVMMALVQKDFKRLLSYHAISQVGYMILGIGTAVPVGIVGGIFHMINHAMYKSCLFLTGGSVESRAGTTDLMKLGGIGKRMPITFACFIIAAAAISGVPPFNGFFSKELVYDGALECHWIYYAGALLGSFLTAASFLKLGHAAFLGRNDDLSSKVKEAPLSMLVPMVVIAGGCVLFGVANRLPLDNLIVPIIGAERAAGHHFSGFPENTFLLIMTVTVLLAAYVNHMYGVGKTGTGAGAVDHIHYAPIFHPIYESAEKRLFDPYDIGMMMIQGIARLAWWIDRANDWLYNVAVVRMTLYFSLSIRRLHSGSYAVYIVWTVVGAVCMCIYMNA
ncbi:MAG: proton-conducting transporter membrane subunit [Geobacteraceae bacterium]|nr:proton-conducting transporter membrane subunit [Geobacteraceae bacterium]